MSAQHDGVRSLQGGQRFGDRLRVIGNLPRAVTLARPAETHEIQRQGPVAQCSEVGQLPVIHVSGKGHPVHQHDGYAVGPRHTR